MEIGDLMPFRFAVCGEASIYDQSDLNDNRVTTAQG